MKYSLSASKFFCHSNFFTNSIFKRPRIYSKRPNNIVFNYRKSAGVLFSPKNFKLSKPPFLLLGLDKIEFVDRVKYLGIIMDSSSNENCDISRQTELSTVLVTSWG